MPVEGATASAPSTVTATPAPSTATALSINYAATEARRGGGMEGERDARAGCKKRERRRGELLTALPGLGLLCSLSVLGLAGSRGLAAARVVPAAAGCGAAASLLGSASGCSRGGRGFLGGSSSSGTRRVVLRVQGCKMAQTMGGMRRTRAAAERREKRKRGRSEASRDVYDGNDTDRQGGQRGFWWPPTSLRGPFVCPISGMRLLWMDELVS